MDEPKRIFIDTSAWIDFTLANETFHKPIFDYLIAEVKKGSKFFTSDYVLDETFTRLLTGQSFKSAKIFRDKIKALVKERQLLILWTEEVRFDKSWALFEKFKEHLLSFTDATVVSYMRDLKIDEILTLDKGFRKVGLTTKPALRV